MGVDNQCYSDPTTCAKSAPASSYLFNRSTEWLITPDSEAHAILLIRAANIVANDMVNVGIASVRPTLYLSSNVYITRGSGTSSDPYILK